MIPQDMEAYRRWVSPWALALRSQLGKPGLVMALCSPNPEQRTLFEQLAGNGLVVSYNRNSWNLEKATCPWGPVNVVVVCNVLHYMSYPELAFTNLFSSCRELWIQDLYLRSRDGDFELGPDGDSERYSLGRSHSGGIQAFDLLKYKDRLMAYHVYDGGSMEIGRTTVHFVARFKGDVA